MGFIRVISIALIVWLMWRMYKNYKADRARAKQQKETLQQKKMVKCQFCSVHLPQNEALNEDNHWFCHRQHQQQYLQQQNK